MSNVAAIDLGSNSCRIVIADNKGKYLLRDSNSTKLSQGMVVDMTLTEESQQRTIDCLKEYAKKINEYGVEKYRAITTAAVRQSKNGADFVKRVKEETGITFDVIDEIEEARLNLVGSLAHIKGKSKYVCVFDIGGASTEVTIATNEDNPQITKTVSIPLGVRKGSEKYDLVEYDDVKAKPFREEIVSYIKDFVLPDDCMTIATSSSALRIASYVYNHDKYVREDCDGLVLNREQINNAVNEVYGMSQSQMAESIHIGKDRSYVFVAAVVLVKTIIDTLKIEELTASLLSAKDAIIKELINE